ncbi:MAG: DUF3311 domain-containing protein [Acidiferrobacter sp.]
MNKSRANWAYVLLILPFVALLWVPFYNKITPTLLGFPFFYWYQLAWVPLSVLLSGIVYLLTKPAHSHP